MRPPRRAGRAGGPAVLCAAMNTASCVRSAALALTLIRITAAAQAPAVHKHFVTPAGYDRAVAPGQPLAPRLQNLGVHTFPVTVSRPPAQLFINQGVNLAYGFNHAEAGRAFAEAARLDPECAMAYWGQALVLGPNINAAMTPEDEPKAFELVRKAIALKPHVSRREGAWIDALAVRYTGNAADRAKADRAYADAMRSLTRAYPDDLDAKTMFAESLMDLRPWNYWTRDGKPYPETLEVRAALEQVIARDRNHPGALHYWVHLWEPTVTPERAEAEADRLLPLMPGAGHIVHMPAHIYMRVGRFADVVSSNQQAVRADEDYIRQCRAQGAYPLGYYPHNIHFVWMGATALGQSGLAAEAARKVSAAITDASLNEAPALQGFTLVPYWTMVRFGRWDEILADKGPRLDHPFSRGAWHFARAMALTATGRVELAEEELAALRKEVDDPALVQPATSSMNTGVAILRIAPEVVAGELAARRQEWDTAVLHLDRAIRYEDALIYQEPPDWPAPVRQTLGAVLLQAGRPSEAEAVYWEDLKKNPGTGWSLYGLWQALRAEQKTDDARAAEARFRDAWKNADVTLTASRLGF
jgi:tetratricopeptide (TPR) repeat protein